MHAKYQVAIFNIAKVYIKWAILTHIFDLWPWRMTLTFHHSKCAAPWDTHACQIWSCYLQYCKIWPLTLTLKDDLDFDLSPLKCAAPWATHACQISSWHVFPLIMTIFKLVLDIECFDQISWWLDKINDLKMSSGHLLVLANLQPWPLYILGHSELDIQLDGLEMTCGHLLVLANLHDKLED